MKEGEKLSRDLVLMRQSLPLEAKIVMTQQRIIEYVNEVDAYLSYSGGKDSSVLLHIIRSMGYDGTEVPAVFCDTGLEYPELRELALKNADVILRPEMSFKSVIETHGYPVMSKHVANKVRLKRSGHSGVDKYFKDEAFYADGKRSMYNLSKKAKTLVDAPFEVSEKCCNVMKKDPMHKYEKETGRCRITGMMACESLMRMKSYQQHGCNSFKAGNISSMPMAFWTEQDVLQYIDEFGVEIPSVYGEVIKDDDGVYSTTGVNRTGCMFCMFGVHLEKEPNRFQSMKVTHPKQYDYCINKLNLKQVLDYIDVPY